MSFLIIQLSNEINETHVDGMRLVMPTHTFWLTLAIRTTSLVVNLIH